MRNHLLGWNWNRNSSEILKWFNERLQVFTLSAKNVHFFGAVVRDWNDPVQLRKFVFKSWRQWPNTTTTKILYLILSRSIRSSSVVCYVFIVFVFCIVYAVYSSSSLFVLVSISWKNRLTMTMKRIYCQHVYDLITCVHSEGFVKVWNLFVTFFAAEMWTFSQLWFVCFTGS